MIYGLGSLKISERAKKSKIYLSTINQHKKVLHFLKKIALCTGIYIHLKKIKGQFQNFYSTNHVEIFVIRCNLGYTYLTTIYDQNKCSLFLKIG